MSNPAIKLPIAASGTGGHVFPAIAVAQKLLGDENDSPSEDATQTARIPVSQVEESKY